MIAANELRLGNLVQPYFADSIMQIASIDKEVVKILNDNDKIISASTHEINPLTLSGRFLNIISDDISEDAKIMTLSKFKFFISEEFEDGKIIYLIIPTANNSIYLKGAPIRYVHEFQNLYFALTGKELEFKKEYI